MITSVKYYTKTKTKNKKWIDRSLGQMLKGKLYRQNHTEAYTNTLTKREKEIYIYSFSQSPLPQFGMIRCLFRNSTDAGYIKLTVEI